MAKAQVDFRIRPSKAVQRHMIVETCRRLAAFAPLSEYQYVGFGGLEFIDFDLMHRALGLSEMFSIESNTYELARYRFNSPFKAVKILPGRASDQLGVIDWGRLSIVWLDYEQQLDEEVIRDVELLCGRLQPGSALFVTVNATPPTRIEGRRSELVQMIGEARIPSNVTDESLAKWGLADAQHRVLTDLITAYLRDRPVRAEWMQVLAIRYADDARMQTVGGIVAAPAIRQVLETCRFKDLDFVRLADEAPLAVRVPMLTAKERRALEEQLPIGDAKQLDVPGLSESDKSAYLQIYRYRSGDRLPA
jgi:hypothetical protein